MNTLLLILILLIIYMFFTNIYEHFNNFQNIKSCCLVEKKFVKDKSLGSLYHGKFKYNFTILNNDKCQDELYNLDSNKQLLHHNQNNWNNKYCNNNSNYLGSCRRSNKECIDFVSKDFCDKYKEMEWIPKTCHDKLDFVWEDKINFKIPNFKNDTFIMFK